jgi:predicted metal-dependent peptidase
MSYELRKALDKTIGEVFSANETFLASLMCNLELQWDEKIPTACTNGKYLKWNPTWFMGLPQNTRTAVMLHELWHVARLHMVRRGKRDPKLWNIACDYRINNDLLREGYTFDGTSPCLDDRFGPEVPEEEIYNQLMQDQEDGEPEPQAGDLEGDMDEAPPTEAEIIQQVQAVSKAIQQAKMCKGAGKIPGGIEDWIQEFLEPVIPWEQVLYQWFVDRSSDDYSWSRPNRRYQEVYLPSMTNSFNQLTKLNYYVDVSGSITREQIIRFNSELKYIKEQFNPEELRVVMFDTEIQEEYIFTDNDTFDRIKVTAGGGTSLVPVREHIVNTQPTAAIVFSDLEVDPMQPLPIEIPVIWACVENPGADVPFGTLIHIKEPKK